MDLRLCLDMLPQPNDTTCGPTCLQAVYNYFGEPKPLLEVIAEVPALDEGGTLAVHLAGHALRRGYEATIYTFNMQVFDPTWFAPGVDIGEKLRLQQAAKPGSKKLHNATAAYLDFLELGGKIAFEDLTTSLIRRTLGKRCPILTGLSSTYLYACAREKGLAVMDYDDIAGEPQGHFVVLCGYDRAARTVLVADPLKSNPMAPLQQYSVDIDRLVNAILLGILTYDANLLMITPKTRAG